MSSEPGSSEVNEAGRSEVEARPAFGPWGRARDVGRLLRLSLAPTAAADAAAGLVFGGGGQLPAEPRAWWLLAASACVYTGALCLNDWADRAHDRRTRPSRPLPAGSVRPRTALALASALLAAGLALAHHAGPGGLAWLAPVAGLAVAYDLGARGPWLGPLLLGLCRAGNLGAGLAVGAHSAAPGAAAATPTGWLAVACVYALYVVLAARLGRMEDGEERLDQRRVRRLVRAAALALLALPLATSFALLGPTAGDQTSPGRWPLEALPVLAAAAGLAPLWRRTAWSAADVQAAMGALLRRLLVVAASVALAAARFPGSAAGGWTAALVAAAILAGYPLAHALRRAFPPS